MKNGEIYGIDMILGEILKVSKSAKLIYGVTKNLERTAREIKRLDAIRKPADKFNEFTRKRITLCEASCHKDEKGQPKTIPGPNGLEYDIIDRPAFDKDLETLRKDYTAVLDEHNAAIARFNKHMDEESEIKVYKIKYSAFEKEQAELEVKDRLNGVQTKDIWFMIDDDVEGDSESKPVSELKMIQ